jgi:hypothetical protein
MKYGPTSNGATDYRALAKEVAAMDIAEDEPPIKAPAPATTFVKPPPPVAVPPEIRPAVQVTVNPNIKPPKLATPSALA